MKQISQLKKDITYLDNCNITLEDIRQNIKNNIREYHESSFEFEKTILIARLIKDYNSLHYLNYKSTGSERMYVLGEELSKLSNVYLVEQNPARFEIDNQIIDSINLAEGLTMEQAMELLKWTVNNTRENINISKKSKSQTDVYENDSLTGWCGFSQFSSLYPLQKLGFNITINNIRNVNGGAHAYGTVVFPIKIGNQIVNKRFLIDCTYRQFFTIPFNVASRYLSAKPSIGFFIHENENLTLFAKKLLKSGFVEANQEELEKYLIPFAVSQVPFENIQQTEDKFRNLDLLKLIEEIQEQFDYDEQEFIDKNFNLELSSAKKK